MSVSGFSNRPASVSVATCQDITRVDASQFPLIADFGVRLYDTGPMFGMHVRLFSRDENLDLASFPWWDHADVDLRAWSLERIPLGSAEQPYDDCEQSWQILIWERDGCVFVAEGDDPSCTDFRACFRVPRATYVDAWRRVLDDAQGLRRPGS